MLKERFLRSCHGGWPGRESGGCAWPGCTGRRTARRGVSGALLAAVVAPIGGLARGALAGGIPRPR